MSSWNILKYIFDDDDVHGDEYMDEMPNEFSMRGGEIEAAYKKGCKHGYQKAVQNIRQAMSGGMSERNVYGNRHGGMGERMMPDDPYMMGMRGYEDDDGMNERRRRNSRGQYM